MERGFFRENDIPKAELIPFRGGPDLLKAGVLPGEIHVGVTGGTDVLVFREAGAPIKQVAALTKGNYWMVIAAPGVKNMAELKGKAIGVTRGGATSWVMAHLLARKQGWDPERDIKILALGGLEAQMAALSRGETAAFLFGDAGALVEHQGTAKVLMTMDSLTPQWISQITYASEDFIKKHPDIVRGCVRAMAQAMRYMLDHPVEAAGIVAKPLNWPPEAVRLAIKIAGPLYSLDGVMDLQAFASMQETLLNMGILKKKLPLAEHYTLDFTPVKL
jgi:NitT/TauT family transport system substrate-binding protein